MKRSLWIWTQGLFAALAMMVLVLPPAQADVPKTMAFQGKLTDASGLPLDGNKTVTFRLYGAVTGGTKLWEEVKTLTVSGGLFSTLLGDKTPLSVAFDQPYWVEIVVGAETLSPRQPLASSPYALMAAGLQGGLKADYDSGWVADNRTTSHRTVFAHQLGFFPSRVSVWFAPSPTSASIYPLDWGFYYSASGNPVQIEVTASQVILHIYSGIPLHGTWDASTGAWTSHNTGYWRVFCWK